MSEIRQRAPHSNGIGLISRPLNELADWVTEAQPIPGAGIKITESPRGRLIELDEDAATFTADLCAVNGVLCRVVIRGRAIPIPEEEEEP